MKNSEISKSLTKTTILIDTREQATAEFENRVASFPCPIERKKLDFGDYSIKCELPDGQMFSLESRVAVERKMSLDELAGNFGKNRKRFEREFERMKNAGGKAYIVCENASLEKIYSHRYRSQYSPESFLASLAVWQSRYNVSIYFISDKLSGYWIYELLFYELRERLKNGEADKWMDKA